ncbi:MAG: AAA family ATPase [Limisphaerales bacterium]
MINRFRVNNFRNLVNVEFRPVRINLVIGPNNAGKTNLSNAIRFVSATASLSLDDAVGMVLGENWNITNAYVQDKLMGFELDMSVTESGVEYAYSYSLQISADREQLTGKQLLKVVQERLFVAGGDLHQVPLIQNNNGVAQLLDEKSLQGTSHSYVQAQVPSTTTALSKLFDPELNRHALRFKNQLANSWYFNIVPHALRSPKVFGKAPVVNCDGTNLNKLLYSLHNENPRLERKIIEALKLVEPKIDLLKFYSPDPDFILFLFEDKQGHPFSPQTMSDGTLRYLVLCGLFALLDEWSHTGGPAPLVIFEEPENGLYVGTLKPLMSRLDFRSTSGQCIFTSHSPYFIDLFDANPEGVHLMKPGMPSPSLLKPDPARLRKLLDDMPLGEMHYRELLG